MNQSISSAASQDNPPIQDEEINLLDLALVVSQNLRFLVGGSLGAGVFALLVAFIWPPMFTAKTQLLPPQQQQGLAASVMASLGALGGAAGSIAGLKNPNDQYVGFLTSRTLQDAIIDRFNLKERYGKDFYETTRLKLENRVKVTAGKDGMIDIEVEDRDPQMAADMANAYIEELSRLMGRVAVTEAQQRRAFFEKQLKQTKDNLIKAEQALQATGVNTSVLKSSPDTAVSDVAILQAQITAQEVKLGSMRGYLTESAPEFKQALTALGAMRSQLSKIDQSPKPPTAEQSDYVSRYREFKYQETLFELFAKQYELARSDEAREGAVIQVVDAAVPPERRSSPKRALIAVLTTLATGFVLLLWVFVRQALANAAADQESARKLKQIKSSFYLWGRGKRHD